MTTPKHIAIFASGKGSNAQAIIDYFKNKEVVKIALIVSNKADAGVFTIASNNHIQSLLISKEQLNDESFLLAALQEHKIDYILLAGFLLLIPSFLVQHFPKRIINIHPALLPKYGGKGMYGMKVHEAICANKESETGITIHFVNENYDEGEYILQQKVAVSADDTPFTVAAKVQKLEHEWFPKAIETVLS